MDSLMKFRGVSKERERKIREMLEGYVGRRTFDTAGAMRKRQADARAFGMTVEQMDAIREMEGATWTEDEYCEKVGDPFASLDGDSK